MSTKSIIILFLLLVFNSYVKSEVTTFGNREADSLVSLIPKTPKDSNLVNLYRDISHSLFRFNTDKGIEYGELSLKLAEKIDWDYGKARAKEVLAINYSIRFEYKKSNEYLYQALKYYIKEKNLKKIGDIYNTLGINENYKINSAKAIIFLDSAIKYYNKINNSEGLVLAYSNYAVSLQTLSKYYEALQTYFNILNLIDKYSIENRRIEITSNIGNTYFLIGDFEEAKKYYFKVLDLIGQEDATFHNSIVYNNIGEVFTEQNELDSALIFIKKALELNKQIGNTLYMCVNLANIGNIFIEKKDYKKALEYIQEAINLAEEFESFDNLILSHFNLGKLYLRLFKENINLNNKNNLKESILNFEISKEYAIEYNDKRRLIDISDLLSEAYMLNNDFKQAYINTQINKKLNDSIINIETKSKMKVLENDYETGLKNKEIEFLKNENKYKSQLNILLFISIFSILSVLIFVYLNFYNKKKQNILLENKVKERTNELDLANQKIQIALNKQQEINKMKSNMINNISHQFRTPLTAISSYSQIIEHKYRNDNDLSKTFLRIKNAIKEMVILIDKVSIFQNITDDKEIVELEEVNLEVILNEVINKVKSNSNSAHIFNVNINVNKLNSNSKLFSQVLELIIENSIKFSNPNSNIDITSISTNNEINIVIEDEGFGIPENEIDFIFDPFFVGSKSNSIKSGTGLGLSIVKENLSLLNGEIKIESEENKGTKVTLVLNNKS